MCFRTVRTRGAVASRQCTCNDPPCFMEIVDAKAEPIDISRFVTYQTEEDLAPTEAELVEELPAREGFTPVSEYVEPKEKKPYRGIGYLRAEAAPEDTSPTSENDEPAPDEWEEFGIGIESPPTLKTSPASPAAVPAQRSDQQNSKSPTDRGQSRQQSTGPQTAEHDSSGEPRKGRKRRRSRRSGPREEEVRDGQTPTSLPAPLRPADPVPTLVTTVNAPAGAGEPKINDTEGSPNGEKRKRRRRGRKRKKGTPGTDAPPASETT